jgi:pimeloyl-ACP methyl ester carboxylesterase
MIPNNIEEQTAVIFEPLKLDLDYQFVLPQFTREVSIPVDQDVDLSGLLYEKHENLYLMVYFQGNAKNLQNFLDNHSMVFDWGYNILVTDYRTFGKSGGQLTGQEQLYADAEKVYEYAIGLGYLPEQIILYGYSMGAAMVSHLAATKPAKAVILESGYSSVNEMDFSSGRCPAYELNNARKAKQISMPALVIHGELDEIITPDHAERIWENLGSSIKRKFIMAGGGHGDLRGRPEYQRLVNDFIDSLSEVEVVSYLTNQ